MREIFVVHCREPRVRELSGVDYDTLPADLQEVFEEHGGLSCDGGGRPGWWCHGCRWMGQRYDWEEEDE